MTIDEIKELIALLSDADITEFKVETDEVKLTIKKEAVAVAAVPPVSVPAPPVPVQGGSDAAGTAPASVPAPPADETSQEGRTTITAPMVGTFYRAPSPDADPYVKTGDRVEVGQPLCIIEAMKLMNEIESEVQGRIVEILAENGQPVEYGQPLFVIEVD